MDTGETSYRARDETDFPVNTRVRTPPQPYRIPREYAPRPPSRPAAPGYLPYPPPPGYPSAGATRQVSRQFPEVPPTLLEPVQHQPASQLHAHQGRQQRTRRPRTWPQLIGGV